MRPSRALLSIGLLGLLASACGQLGGVHRVAAVTAPRTSTPSVSGTGGGSSGLADSGPTATGGSLVDIGGDQGVSISGDSTAPAGTSGTQPLTTTVTSTSQLPQHFAIHVVQGGKGPFYACPVAGQFTVGDSFGADRFAGGFHPHAGNDILAAAGTPIVAPFDGVAEADPNTLGGNAVIVRGKDGYVYNAHLSAYGRLGNVHAGEVIGYVGDTGDARGGPTHDHFEWHPFAGPGTDSSGRPWTSPYGYVTVPSGNPVAVDPYPFLLQVCQ